MKEDVIKDKIILFGASNFLIKTYCYLSEEFDITFICDNNEQKWRNELFGVKIIPPFELKKYKYDKIIITSSYYEDIKSQLIILGVDIKKMFYIDIYENISEHNFNISFKVRKLKLYDYKNLEDNNFVQLIDQNFINIKEGKIFDVHINSEEVENLKYELKEYFESYELLENAILTTREVIELISIHEFNIIRCLYNLDNKFVMNKILKFLSISSKIISDKNLLKKIIDETFKDKQLTFVEKADYYSMISSINGLIREYKHGCENLIIEFNYLKIKDV